MYGRVMREDKVLCNAAQRNLESGVFVGGLMHPKYEKAPLFFQQTVREVVKEHWGREKQAGKEIWAARQRVDGVEGDEEICAAITCREKKVLDW